MPWEVGRAGRGERQQFTKAGGGFGLNRVRKIARCTFGERRSGPRGAPPSLQPQLRHTVLVEAEHVPDLVEQRDADLLDELLVIARGAFEVALE